MATLSEIVKNPAYTNANAATKRAIFEKYAPNDPAYANANAATQKAIRAKFGIEQAVQPSRQFGAAPREEEPFEPQTLAQAAGRGLKQAGAVTAAGFGSFGEKLIRALPGTAAEEALGTKVGQSRRMMAEMAGMSPESGAFGVGEFGVELAGTAGAPAVLAKGLNKLAAVAPGQAANIINRIAPYVEGAGFAERAAGVGRATDIGLRAAGGAAAALPAAYVVSPETMGEAAAIGAALPVAAKPVGAVLQAGRNALNKALNPMTTMLYEKVGPEGAERILDALKTQQAIVPGTQPGVGELTAVANVPEWSSLIRSIEGAASDVTMQRDIINALAREQQGMRAAIAAGVQRQAAMPEATGADVLAGVRGGAERALEAERAGVLAGQEQALRNALAGQAEARNVLAERQRQALGGVQQARAAEEVAAAERFARQRAGLDVEMAEAQALESIPGAVLPKVSPMETGERIRAMGEIRARGAQVAVNEKYAKAFQTFKGNVDISGLETEARALGQKLTSFRTSGLSDEGRETLRALGAGTGDEAARLSLPDVIELRNEVSARLRSAASGEKTNQAEVAALRDIVDRIDSSIASSVPKKTQAALQRAKDFARTEKIEKFYQGVMGKALAEGAFGRPGLLPEDIFGEVLKKEQYAKEAVRSFGDDTESLAALKQGVLDQYRRKVAPEGVIDLAKHQAFMRENEDALNILDRAYKPSTSISNAIKQVSGVAEKAAATRAGVEAKIGAIGEQEKQAIEGIKSRFKLSEAELKAQQRAEKIGMTAAQRQERDALRSQGAAKMREAQQKYAEVLGYRSADQLRRSVIDNPASIKNVTQYMDEPARKQFANDVVTDVLSVKPEKVSEAVEKNAKALQAALKEADPKNADLMFQQLQQYGVTIRTLQKAAKSIEQRGLAATKTLTPENRFAAQKEIDELTKGFTSQEKADARALVRDAERAATYDELAKRGTFKSHHLASEAFKDVFGGPTAVPSMIDRLNTTINFLATRFRNKLDRQTATELAIRLQTREGAAQLIKEAMELGQKPGFVEKTREATAKVLRQAPLMYSTAQE